MTERIGKSLLAREAILAALEAKQRAAPGAQSPQRPFAEALGAAVPDGSSIQSQGVQKTLDIGDTFAGSLGDVDRSVKRAEALEEALVTGQVQDFHEVAIQVKQADLGFRFALEVRNRLIDAYREVMRMNV